MSTQQMRVRNAPQFKIQPAKVAFWLTAAFLACVVVLHVIEPELSPRWRTVSEYSLGRYSWLMNLAFLVMGMASITLAVALWRFLDSRIARLGGLLLAVWGVCSVLSAFFPTDSSPDIAKHLTTRTGAVHTLIGDVGLLSFVLAVSLVARALRRHPAWRPARGLVLWATFIAWAGLAVALVSSAQMGMSGGPSPSSWFGIGERILPAANLVWMVAIAGHATKPNTAAAVAPRGN